MAKILVRDTQPGDAEALLADIREPDRLELMATTSTDPLTAIKQSIALSSKSWCLTVDGRVGIVAGVAPVVDQPQIGIPWMAATNHMCTFPGALTRFGARYSSIMLESYRYLVNFVDIRNTSSIRWLRLMGYDVSTESFPVGVDGALFHRFTLGL